MKRLTLSIILALLVAIQIVAQETSLAAFKTYVLLVGVSDYEHHNDLINPVIDVKAIEEELREVYKCEAKMLLNPTRRQFLQELRQVAKQRYDANDQLLVLFSGHGWFDEVTKRGYLALKDSKPLADDTLFDSYVSHEDVRTILERLDCKHVLLIVDSCFSGTLDPTIAMANQGRATDLYSSVPRAEYLNRKLKYKTRRYITAGGKEYVSDGRPGHHSPFARRILESLRSFGGRDGILTLEEMMIEIEKTKPEPRTGELLGNEPGSSFVLIASSEPELPKPEPRYDGELIVLVTPAKVQVTVEPLDEAQRDIRPKPTGNRFRLLFGRYRVRASLAGYETKTQDVHVVAKENVVNLTLNIAEEIVGKDGAKMVLIPAGDFEMGSKDGQDDESPVHKVYLDVFYMDKYLVTNAQYAKFLNEYGKNSDAAGNRLIFLDDGDCLIEKNGDVYQAQKGYENHPVVEVSWHGAVAYAQHYGKRLPTEAEWEKAARGGLVGKKYPWGDEPSHDDANYSGTGGRDKWEKTAPVGSFPENGYGLFDMAGNVNQWCTDLYAEDYYLNSPSRNPKGPKDGTARVCRGGSWRDEPLFLRCANRGWCLGLLSNNLPGFRCVVSSPGASQ